MSTDGGDRIDDELAGFGSPGETTDPTGPAPDDDAGDEDGRDLKELREQLALTLPKHTFFEDRHRGGPTGIVIGPGGPQIVRAERSLTGIKARWSTPAGMWRVTAVLCPGSDGLVHYEIKGPHTLLRRGDQTIGQLVDKLSDVDAI